MGVIKCSLRDFAGRGPLEVYTWFLLDFAHETFPFADFVLCPFAVINRSHEYSQLILVNCSGYVLKVTTNTELASTEPLLLRKIYTSLYTYLT